MKRRRTSSTDDVCPRQKTRRADDDSLFQLIQQFPLPLVRLIADLCLGWETFAIAPQRLLTSTKDAAHTCWEQLFLELLNRKQAPRTLESGGYEVELREINISVFSQSSNLETDIPDYKIAMYLRNTFDCHYQHYHNGGRSTNWDHHPNSAAYNLARLATDHYPELPQISIHFGHWELYPKSKWRSRDSGLFPDFSKYHGPEYLQQFPLAPHIRPRLDGDYANMLFQCPLFTAVWVVKPMRVELRIQPKPQLCSV